MIELKKLLAIGLFFLIAACGSDNDVPNTPDTPDVPGETYTAPTYADDYSSIAGWDRRVDWNLANVHDPTVEKCGDYYYMYTTDASYGNAYDGHGLFF